LHTIDAARTIYRSEGIRAFYRGLLPSLLGIAHVAVQFPLYEQLKIWARKLILRDFHEHAILSYLYVISRGSLGCSASTAGNPPLLCNREDDGLDSDIPARSRSNAVTDAETTASGRHVVGRDGQAAFSTRSGLHCEEDRDQGGLVGVIQGAEREPDKDGTKQRCHYANVRCSTLFAQVYSSLTSYIGTNY